MEKHLRYCVTCAAAAAVFVCGCRQDSHVSDDSMAVTQMPAGAISASCFVRSYHADGSYYLTRQSQNVEPYAGFIQLAGSEPDGPYFWQLSGGLFTVSQGRSPEAKWLPPQMAAVDFSRLVLGCFQAPMVGQGPDASPVRIRGNWAYPAKAEGPLAWYRSAENSAVADIVTVQRSDGGWYVARGYGHYPTRDARMLVPAKIEIFRTDAASLSEQMLLSLEYID